MHAKFAAIMLCRFGGALSAFTHAPAMRKAQTGALVHRFSSLRMMSAAASSKKLQADKFLQSQGFGSRKFCKELIEGGLMSIGGQEVLDSKEKIEVQEGMEFAVGEEEWQYRTNVYVVLNKPAGYECSNKPSAHASIFELFPEQFQVRGVQSVGRLDQDTTGMLLLSDDGQFIHAMTSPKREKEKVYHVTVKHPVTPELVDSLSAGVELKDEPGTIVTPTAVKQLEETLVELSLTEGKYHQVKRMIAACGNRVEKLHRASIAGMVVPAAAPPPLLLLLLLLLPLRCCYFSLPAAPAAPSPAPSPLLRSPLPRDLTSISQELPAGLEEGGWKYLTEEEVKQLLSGHLQASIK